MAARATSTSQWTPAWPKSMMTPRSEAARTSGRSLSWPVQDALVVAVEGVGGDVAGPHEVQDLGQGYGSAADVNHQPAARLVGGGPGPAHGLGCVPVGNGVQLHPHLYAKEESGVILDSVGGLVNVDDAQVLQAAAEHPVGGQAHGTDVDEGQQAGAVGRKNVVTPWLPGSCSRRCRRQCRW